MGCVDVCAASMYLMCECAVSVHADVLRGSACISKCYMCVYIVIHNIPGYLIVCPFGFIRVPSGHVVVRYMCVVHVSVVRGFIVYAVNVHSITFRHYCCVCGLSSFGFSWCVFCVRSCSSCSLCWGGACEW